MSLIIQNTDPFNPSKILIFENDKLLLQTEGPMSVYAAGLFIKDKYKKEKGNPIQVTLKYFNGEQSG